MSAGEASFSGTKASGVLTVSDGTHIAHITLIGDFRHTAFVTSNTGAGVAVQASGGAALASPHPFVAAMAAMPSAGEAAPVMADAHAKPWRPDARRRPRPLRLTPSGGVPRSGIEPSLRPLAGRQPAGAVLAQPLHGHAFIG